MWEQSPSIQVIESREVDGSGIWTQDKSMTWNSEQQDLLSLEDHNVTSGLLAIYILLNISLEPNIWQKMEVWTADLK